MNKSSTLIDSLTETKKSFMINYNEQYWQNLSP